MFGYLIDKTERYLKMMKKNYEKNYTPYGMPIFIVKDEIEDEETGRKIPIVISIIFPQSDKWVQIISPVLPLEELSKDDIFRIYELCLVLNNELADTAFEIDKDLNLLMISNELHIDGFVYDVFEEEYEAILQAILQFRKEVSKFIKNVDELTKKGFEKLLRKFKYEEEGEDSSFYIDYQ